MGFTQILPKKTRVGSMQGVSMTKQLRKSSTGRESYAIVFRISGDVALRLGWRIGEDHVTLFCGAGEDKNMVQLRRVKKRAAGDSFKLSKSGSCGTVSLTCEGQLCDLFPKHVARLRPAFTTSKRAGELLLNCSPDESQE